MDFQNINLLNARLNKFSGNLLPMTNDNSSFPIIWKMYGVIIWLMEIIQITAIISGTLFVSKDKALHDSTVTIIVTIEIIFLLRQMHVHKDVVIQLIEKLNEILHIEDKTMEIIIKSTLKSVNMPLNFYWSAGVISILAWNCISITLAFKKDLFYYEDYRIPSIFSNQPFSFTIFLLGSLFILINSVFLFLKKVAMDVYMIHLVLMITAQYKYIMLKIATIFQEKDQINKFQKKYSFEVNRRKEKEIKALCLHHNNVVHISSLLKKLLSLNFSLIYVNSVFRFCFIGIMVSSIVSTSLWEGISIVIYTSGAIVQLYILCSCVQQLLDASTEMTDKAFHENWFLFQPSIKSTFILIIMANNLECKIATFEKFNLSLPSFMMILNQAYSITLLILKMK